MQLIIIKTYLIISSNSKINNNYMLNIIIGGDICPIGRNSAFFKEGDAGKIFNDLLEDFEGSDLSIVNLECALINESTPILKNEPVIGVDSDCINGFKNAGIDILNLANNHILDHGAAGLKNTMKVCAGADILTVGAGESLKEARRMLIKKVNNVNVGILAVAEHEFSIATQNSWGANPLDLIDYVRNVKSQKDNFDYLIVLLHGGNEYYPFPSPRMKDTCHFMVEMGANMVVVQHTHCPACYEEYQNAHIIYGQGNLIFDWPDKPKSFYEGFLVKLLIDDQMNPSVRIVPYVQSNLEIGARKMSEDDELLFMKALEERSLAVKNDDFIRSQWLTLCDSKKNQYISSILGHNRLFRRLNKHGHLVKYLYSQQSLIAIQNMIVCESHREVLETILNDLYNVQSTAIDKENL